MRSLGRCSRASGFGQSDSGTWFTTTHRIKKELSICQSLLCLALKPSKCLVYSHNYSSKARSFTFASLHRSCRVSTWLRQPIRMREDALGVCGSVSRTQASSTVVASLSIFVPGVGRSGSVSETVHTDSPTLLFSLLAAEAEVDKRATDVSRVEPLPFLKSWSLEKMNHMNHERTSENMDVTVSGCVERDGGSRAHPAPGLCLCETWIPCCLSYRPAYLSPGDV